MFRSARALVAGVVLLGLVLGQSPAVAEEADSPTAPQPSAAGEVGLSDLPVDAVDVTQTDASLRSTANEVAVITTADDGSTSVTKLRADSPADAVTLAEHLDAQPGVVAAPNARVRAFEAVNPEPMAAEQWNLPMVGAPDAWAVTQGAGVIVAVIDTGVDASHPDLVGRVLPEIDLLPEIVTTPADNAHGTRVASIVAGALNGVGIAGVAPAASILPVAALDPSGVGDTATVAEAIVAAADAGARVINLSLGGPDPDPVLDRACVYAYTRGAILVAAAGNSYEEGNAVQYPAASPNVVAVASVTSAATESNFSNTGAYVDLAAPGQDVYAAIPGGLYDVQSGTSFAAPHVAGTLALVAAANPALNVAQIVSAVELTAADDISGNGRDDAFGYGIVRADRAVTTALSMAAATVPPGSKLRLRGFDGAPERIRRGEVGTFTVWVQARYPDRVWRPELLPTLVRFEFRPNGSRRYRVVADVATDANGAAVLSLMPTRSGTWRAKVRQDNGKWVRSGIDRVKVRR